MNSHLPSLKCRRALGIPSHQKQFRQSPTSSSINSLSSDNDLVSDTELAASQSSEQSPSQSEMQESSWHPQPSETVQAVPTSSSINSLSSDNDLVSDTELAASQSYEQSPSRFQHMATENSDTQGLEESSWHVQPSETVQAIPSSSSMSSFSSDNSPLSEAELESGQSYEQSPSQSQRMANRKF